MAEKILVAQALDERDTLLIKIAEKIMNARFVDTMKENETKVCGAGIAKEDFEKEAKEAFQQIMDLIDRYGKLDEKIIISNANTYIRTSCGTMSVASAIVRRDRIRGAGPYEDQTDLADILAHTMQLQYDQSVQLTQSQGGPLEVTEACAKQNAAQLVDPLCIPKKLEELAEKRETLLRELDAQIEASNAATYIEL